MDRRMLWKVLLVIIATATSASELMGAYGQETGGGNAGGPTRRYNAPTEAPRRSEPYYHRSPFKNNLDPRDRLPKAERELAPGHSLSKAERGFAVEHRPTDSAPQSVPAWPETHIVAKGESLSTIAWAAYGKDNWQKIYGANKSKIKNPDVIWVGQELILPEP
jgi:nucleoid-associated protein YgaU